MGDILKIKRRNVSFLVYEHESPNIYDFWHNENWENFTYEVLENFLDKEHSYIDVGVHLGETILFGAQLSKTCYAVEPDPECIRIASKNIELNNINNIKLIPKAFHDRVYLMTHLKGALPHHSLAELAHRNVKEAM